MPTHCQALFILNYIHSNLPQVATDWIKSLHPLDSLASSVSHMAPSLAMISRWWSLGTPSLPKQNGKSLLAGIPSLSLHLSWLAYKCDRWRHSKYSAAWSVNATSQTQKMEEALLPREIVQPRHRCKILNCFLEELLFLNSGSSQSKTSHQLPRPLYC